MRAVDVVVIGGGQAGLAAGYHLRRRHVDFVIDAQQAPGGAWQHTWDSLHLFSPAAYSSLPGRQLHTVNYRRPADFTGQKAIVVGGGNSGAQIAADIDLLWVTQRPPGFLADDIDGRALPPRARGRPVSHGCTCSVRATGQAPPPPR